MKQGFLVGGIFSIIRGLCFLVAGFASAIFGCCVSTKNECLLRVSGVMFTMKNEFLFHDAGRSKSRLFYQHIVE